MSDDPDTIRVLDVFKKYAVEADDICKQLNTIFDGHSTSACIMAMGAIIGSQMGADGDDEQLMQDRMTLLIGAINLQVGAQNMLDDHKKTMN